MIARKKSITSAIHGYLIVFTPKNYLGVELPEDMFSRYAKLALKKRLKAGRPEEIQELAEFLKKENLNV